MRIIIVVLFSLSCVKGATFVIDAQGATSPFPHVWEESVGSGHATLALRRDWQEHLTVARRELGFKRVRFHGLFDDDMSVFFMDNNTPTYSWFNIDQAFDFLLSIGVRPYVELSFMPELMASGSSTVFHYKGNTTPPKNYTLWDNLITEFANHIIARYTLQEVSTWSFEVWNEPNCGFWSADQAAYFNHYLHTHLAIKKANSALHVGGPATCQSAWIPEFLTFCKNNNIVPDFVSTHQYPTDITPITIDIMTQVFSQARKQTGALPLYYSEFNDGLYFDPPFHDYPYASAYLVRMLNEVKGLVDIMSWWTFTDIFEEQGQNSAPFFGADGWGLLNIYGVPKPIFRAFEILHNV
jgi:xylan 1,4-beta-xylosidase